MKKSVMIGAVLGLLLTLGIGFFLVETKVIDMGRTKFSANPAEPRDPIQSPLATMKGDFNPKFNGSGDLIARRAALKPSMRPDIWEKTLSAAGLPVFQRTTSGCRFANIASGIFIHATQASAIEKGESNILLLPNTTPRCYSTGSKVILALDNIVGGTAAYQIMGQATIERLVEVEMAKLSESILPALGMNREDLPYLAFGTLNPVNMYAAVTMLLITVDREKPVLDPTVIPGFVAGADVVKPSAIRRLFPTYSEQDKPYFLDARDPSARAHGTYAGALQAPMVSSNPAQLRFQLNTPLTVLAGAAFRTDALIKDSFTVPYLVFGDTANDPTALWVIRNLRLLGHRRLYFVEGGLEALQKVPHIKF